MRLYSVHAPPGDPLDLDRARFVKEGFSWPALFFPVLFLLWHRLWLALVWYVVFVLAVMWIGRLSGADPATLSALLGGILFAFEANNIRRGSLGARGWREIGGTSGRGIEEAEARFFGRWSAQGERGATIARAAYPPAARERGADEPILGLFPEPEV
jgi:hypothetical protein